MSASESAFNKRLAPETTADKVEGLLEHFNLPPKVITFIRAHLRQIQIALVLVIITVVTWSLYGSYRERITEEASSALSSAMAEKDDVRANALRAVVEKYGSTSSAIWARVELAHLDMKNGAFRESSEKYSAILTDVDLSNPLYPLVLFSLAQALEQDGQYDKASSRYDQLKEFKGFEYIGFSGMGRLEEAQGKIDKAIAIYNNFVLFAGDDPSLSQSLMEIDSKIARLKALQ